MKIYEAMAMGTPVVATSVGVEGLPLMPGTDFVLADDPGDFASAIVRLLQSPKEARAMGARGAEMVGERFGWEASADRFAEICRAVVERGPRRGRFSQ